MPPKWKITEQGLIPARRMPNPEGLDWGTVVVKRNGKPSFGQCFRGHEEKKHIISRETKEIVTRKDVGNHYEVRIYYGLSSRQAFRRSLDE